MMYPITTKFMTNKYETFDLKVGDIVLYKDIDRERAEISNKNGTKAMKKCKIRYEVIAIHKHFFEIRKLKGNHRIVGVTKGAYHCGEVNKVYEDITREKNT